MRKTISAVLLVACLGLASTGCYSTVEGRTRAGVPWAKDSIEGRYERPLDQVYAAARKVLEFNGTLRGDNSVTKTLEARVNTRLVWVKVDEAGPNLTRVVVQARTTSGGTDIDLAAEIEKQVALQLK